MTSRFDYINGDIANTLQQRGLLVVFGIVFRTLFILGEGYKWDVHGLPIYVLGM